MAQREPTVLITDADGNEVVRDEPAAVPARLAPNAGRFEIRQVTRPDHTTYEIWVPDVLMVEAPAEVLGMLQSGDLSRVVLGLYKLTKQAMAAGEAMRLQNKIRQGMESTDDKG